MGPYRDGMVHVQADKCATCIFHPGNMMWLQPGTVKEMVDSCLADPAGAGNIPCHETLGGPEAICHGFWEGYADRQEVLLLAKLLRKVEYVQLHVEGWSQAEGSAGALLVERMGEH